MILLKKASQDHFSHTLKLQTPKSVYVPKGVGWMDWGSLKSQVDDRSKIQKKFKKKRNDSPSTSDRERRETDLSEYIHYTLIRLD